MSETSDGTGGGGISNQLAMLVPSFDPSKDDMMIYQQKVELVLAAWPKGKITELVTRLILNCQGTAFQKLQIHQSELLQNDEKCVHKIIELLGGQWGRIALERQYEYAETALFQCHQRQDESHDSYLARSDVMWSRFLHQKIKIEDIQPYIVLRGSLLTPEEKKKVILESDQSLEGKLTIRKVSDSIRVLGATFFNELSGLKKPQRSKVYDQTTLLAQDDDVQPDATLQAEDLSESEFLDVLVGEGDDDATLVADFEQSASELLQEDPELASAFSAYQDARRRLSEKFRNRGFWPTSKSTPKGKGYGGGSKFGGGKGRKGGVLTDLADLCRKGSWPPIAKHVAAKAIGKPRPIQELYILWSCSSRLIAPVTTDTTMRDPRKDEHPKGDAEINACFASYGSHGVLDLGASKTVIGSEGVSELIQSLDEDTRSQLSRCPCKITFRFGNQATLSSSQALVIPIGKMKLKVAIVPGGTPFLLSNTFMRAIQATIDCANHSFHSPILQRPVSLALSTKGLFLVDVNHLVAAARDAELGRRTNSYPPTETFVSVQPGRKEAELTQIPHVRSADMSLSNRLRLMQMRQPPAAVEVEDLSQLTREDLATEVISFGQKHQGETFLQAWQDQEWVAFMVSRYSQSVKDSHRRFIRFVELQVEHFEQEQAPVLPSRNPIPASAQPKAKTKAKATPKSRVQPPEEIEIMTATEFEMEEEWDPAVPYLSNQETMQAMQERLLHMENALLRVMRHLEDQSTAAGQGYQSTPNE
eukprot:s2495_g6.t1